jgi:hypothetical protein
MNVSGSVDPSAKVWVVGTTVNALKDGLCSELGRNAVRLLVVLLDAGFTQIENDTVHGVLLSAKEEQLLLVE